MKWFRRKDVFMYLWWKGLNWARLVTRTPTVRACACHLYSDVCLYWNIYTHAVSLYACMRSAGSYLQQNIQHVIKCCDTHHTHSQHVSIQLCACHSHAYTSASACVTHVGPKSAFYAFHAGGYYFCSYGPRQEVLCVLCVLCVVDSFSAIGKSDGAQIHMSSLTTYVPCVLCRWCGQINHAYTYAFTYCLVTHTHDSQSNHHVIASCMLAHIP
jgi:hypothetical protein